MRQGDTMDAVHLSFGQLLCAALVVFSLLDQLWKNPFTYDVCMYWIKNRMAGWKATQALTSDFSECLVCNILLTDSVDYD